MYNFIAVSKSKKIIATFFVLGALVFAVSPADGRHHGFRGGSIEDSKKIEEEIKWYAAEAEKYMQMYQKYSALVQKFCTLTGLNAPAFLNTVDKYSNAYMDFAGKTIVDMDNKTTSELDLIKDMGQYDMYTEEGRLQYKKHLIEQYQLTNVEAMQLMSRYAANNEVKQKMIEKAIEIKTPTTSGDENSSSRVAEIQKGNIVSGLQANADINNAQNEVLQMTNKAERTRLELLQKNLDRTQAATLNMTPDPYHMDEEAKEKWKEINQPEVTLGFTGKKK